MKKFVALYLAPAAEITKFMKDMTPENMKAGMDEWQKWMTEHASDLVDSGAPLGKTKRVSTDGVSDTKNEVTGYSIVQADSHDKAAQLFNQHPHLQIPGGTIEVMEWVEMPEM